MKKTSKKNITHMLDSFSYNKEFVQNVQTNKNIIPKNAILTIIPINDDNTFALKKYFHPQVIWINNSQYVYRKQ